MRRSALASALLAAAWLAAACTTPLALGERRYREGDRLEALEVWRSVSPDSPYYERVRTRITEVENEFDQLVVRYKKRARYYERRDRLAESILNYRLALELQPDDRSTLSRVQGLVRKLDERKRDAERELEQALAAGELARARAGVETLQRLDPFDPRLEVADQRLDEALRGEVETRLARGRRGFGSGDHVRATRAFREVLELDPENEAARGYLAYIATIQAEDQGPGNGATPLVRASEREIRAEGQYRNAIRAEREGRHFAAIRHDLRALQLAPRHSAAGRHLADLRRQLGNRVDGLIEEGRLHYEREELESALDDWNNALLIDPANARAREFVARAERLLENLERLRDDSETRGIGAR